MKIKYFLRGTGFGLLLAAILMLVFIRPNYEKNGTDEISDAVSPGIKQDEIESSMTLDENRDSGKTTESVDKEDSGKNKDTGKTADNAGNTEAGKADDVKDEELGTEVKKDDKADDSKTADKEEKVDTGNGEVKADENAGGTEDSKKNDNADNEDNGNENSGNDDNSSEVGNADKSSGEEKSDDEVKEKSGDVVSAALVIERNTRSQDFCKAAEEKGVIDNWSDLNNYLIKNGYESKLRSGTYTISSDMSYSEIAAIITKRK